MEQEYSVKRRGSYMKYLKDAAKPVPRSSAWRYGVNNLLPPG